MPSEAVEQSLLTFLEGSGGDWLVAECAAEFVERLREMDHHVVVVNERLGILLTYHLWAGQLPQEPRVYVLFKFVDGHPRAPDDVQRIVELLSFTRR